MMRVVSSANVACGFHGGDPTTLRTVCTSAAAHGVVIGAQVSYPDLLGFGRRFLAMTEAELRDAVLYQLGALDAFAQVAGAEVAYVKPHGALYHATIDNEEHARAVVQAAAEYDPSLAVLGFPGSLLLVEAERAELEAVPEAFIDRAYGVDGRLVPALGARRCDHRSGGGRGACGAARGRRRGHRDRRQRDQRAGAIAVRARRQRRGGRPGDRGAPRARRRRRRRVRVHRGDGPTHGPALRRQSAARHADRGGAAGGPRVAFSTSRPDVVEVVPAAETVLVMVLGRRRDRAGVPTGLLASK